MRKLVTLGLLAATALPAHIHGQQPTQRQVWLAPVQNLRMHDFEMRMPDIVWSMRDVGRSLAQVQTQFAHFHSRMAPLPPGSAYMPAVPAVPPLPPAAAPAPAAPPMPAPAAPLMPHELPPESWAQQDPADALWRSGRQALDRGDNAAAAAAYQRIRTESAFARSAYRPQSYYWEAFARQRIGTATELRTARRLLTDLRRVYPNYEDTAGVEGLLARVDAALAANGDAAAASRTAAAAARATQCPDLELRTAAVEALISMPAEQAMPLLKQVMERQDACNAKLREHAVFLIARLSTPESEDILLQAARTDPNATVREQSVFWLSRVNSEKAVDAIQDILRTSTDRRMVEQAVFALSQHKSPRATELLRDIAARPNASTAARASAIQWIGRRSDAETGAFLRSLYGSVSEQQLKEAIIHAVSRRPNENSGEWLMGIALNERESTENRKQALFWAGRQGAVPVSRLVDTYNRTTDRELKEQIVFTISRRSEPEALDGLIDIARRETNVEFRKTILMWIGRSSDPRKTRFLAEIIGS